MANILYFLLELPFWIRVMFSLFLVVVLWRIVGKSVFWILSVVPLGLRKIFLLLYQVMELPIAMLHKKWGAAFYNIDNYMVVAGEKIDSFFKKWYEYWHSKYRFHLGKACVVYVLCVIFIITPSLMSIKNDLLKKGEEAYLFCETAFVEGIEKYFDYDSVEEAAVIEKEQEIVNEEMTGAKIELIVAGVNSSLLVRDIPDMMNGIALERLHNGDIVVWTGEMVFAEAEDDHVEAWAKVITQNDVEGWSRLFYLHPQDYENTLLYISYSQNIK